MLKKKYNHIDCLKKVKNWLAIVMGVFGAVYSVKAIFEKDKDTQRYYSIKSTLLLVLYMVMTRNCECECKCVCNNENNENEKKCEE